jgi:hypothetical protein
MPVLTLLFSRLFMSASDANEIFGKREQDKPGA